MALKREQIAAWQRRIEQTFRGPNGICGERALRLNEAERAHQRETLGQCEGFMRLTDAFQDFAIQTIDESLTHTPTVHAFRLAFFIASLRRFRVGLNVFWQGYYFDAAANMRAVFENVLYFGAVLNDYISLMAMMGDDIETDITSVSSEELEKIWRRKRSDLDRIIKDKMRGSESGLTGEDQTELKSFLDSMHSHVHRTESNIVKLMMEMNESRRASQICPSFDKYSASIFANTAVCLGWAFMRVVPFLSQPGLFSADWRHRYRILDEAFALYIDTWEKPLGPAFKRFIASKMTFVKV